jgi:hypothetical protein
VLRIWNVYPGTWILDPNFCHPGSGSEFFPPRIPKNGFYSSQKYDPGCSSRIRILDPDPDFLPIPDPGVKKAPDPGARVGIRNTEKSIMKFAFRCLEIFLFTYLGSSPHVPDVFRRDSSQILRMRTRLKQSTELYI